jgi:ribosomal protein L35AE/L33A
VNKAKKFGEAEKMSTFKRNMAKFLAKNRNIRQNRKARIYKHKSLYIYVDKSSGRVTRRITDSESMRYGKSRC